MSGVNWAHYFLSVLADMIYLILRESALPPGFQVLLEIADWHLWCMVGLILGCICLLMLFRFLYDFVTFPNRLFSATIISSVIHNGDIKKTGEWQLLLTSIALPGVVTGALLCNPLGRRNSVSSRIQCKVHLHLNERAR